MASTAPMVLPCERCSSWRSELATGSLAGVWAKANVAKPERARTMRIRFTESLLRVQGYNVGCYLVMPASKRFHHGERGVTQGQNLNPGGCLQPRSGERFARKTGYV